MILRRYLRLILGIPVLKIRCLQGRSIGYFLDLAFSFRLGRLGGLAITPFQIKEEIMELLKILANLKPKAVLEIGTGNGGTLFLFTRIAEPEAMIISVDLPGGIFGGGYPGWKIPLFKSFARNGQKIYLVRDDSHDPATLREVKRIFGDAKVDFLFIDGDHRYEAVKKDFEMYSPLVKKGGIIVFHDIVDPSKIPGCEVNRFWNELKDNYKHDELVKNYNQGTGGIGVLYV